MPESIKHEELKDFEQQLQHDLGLVIIKPDSIELGIDDFLVDQITKKLNEYGTVNLVGGVIWENLERNDIGVIYPDLSEKPFEACVKLFSNASEIVLIFESQDKSFNIWDALKKIKGNVSRGHGFEDSIRAAIPIPSKRESFEKISKKIESGNLSDSDYIEMAGNLIHSPDDIREFAGIFSLIPEEELTNCLGVEKTLFLKESLTPLIKHRQ